MKELVTDPQNLTRYVFDSIHFVCKHNVFDSYEVRTTHLSRTDISLSQVEQTVKGLYTFEKKPAPVILSAVGFLNDGTVVVLKELSLHEGGGVQ